MVQAFNYICSEARYGKQDYLSWSGDWQAGGEEQASGYNQALAEVIAEGVMAEMAKGKAEKEVADVPLRLALIGAPFSGKTTMARKLAEECGCKVTSCRPDAAAERRPRGKGMLMERAIWRGREENRQAWALDLYQRPPNILDLDK